MRSSSAASSRSGAARSELVGGALPSMEDDGVPTNENVFNLRGGERRQ